MKDILMNLKNVENLVFYHKLEILLQVDVKNLLVKEKDLLKHQKEEILFV